MPRRGKFPLTTEDPTFQVPLSYEVAETFSRYWYGMHDPLYAVLSRRPQLERSVVYVEATADEVARLKETAAEAAQSEDADERQAGKRFLQHVVPGLEDSSPKSKLLRRILDDPFLEAYFDAILFTGNDESDDSGGDPLDDNYGIDAFAYESMVEQVAQCEKFLALPGVDAAIDGDYSQAGYDFLMTRNGHGVGFWETGDWPEKAGELLTKASEKMGEVYIYLGDNGEIDVDGG